MTPEDIKSNIRALLNLRPEHERALNAGVAHSIQTVWDATIWSWRIRSKTLTTTSSATVALPSEVETVLEMTYGSNNRVLYPVPHSRLAEIYSNIARDGDTMYYYLLNHADSDHLTIEFVPVVSGETVTYFYLIKNDSGDLTLIPPKLHSLVQVGVKTFMEAGAPEASQIFQSMLERAIIADRPIIHKRWTMALDGSQRYRIDARNSVRNMGTSQDVAHPYD